MTTIILFFLECKYQKEAGSLYLLTVAIDLCTISGLVEILK